MKLNMISVALSFEFFLDRGRCVVLHYANVILGKGKPRHYANRNALRALQYQSALRFSKGNLNL